MSLFSTLGKLAGVVGSVLPGPAGAVAGGISTVLGGGGSRPVLKPLAPTMDDKIRRAIGQPSVFPSGLPSPDSVKVTMEGTSIGPGGSLFATGTGTATAYFPQSQNGTACAKPGHRMNKSSYFLKDGTFVPAGTRCVKSRRRNPLNPRALSRAMGRLASAKKAAKALDRFEVKSRRCR